MFYVVCYLYAPSYQEKFQVGVNLLGNKHFLILILILNQHYNKFKWNLSSKKGSVAAQLSYLRNISYWPGSYSVLQDFHRDTNLPAVSAAGRLFWITTANLIFLVVSLHVAQCAHDQCFRGWSCDPRDVHEVWLLSHWSQVEGLQFSVHFKHVFVSVPKALSSDLLSVLLFSGVICWCAFESVEDPDIVCYI